jgi:hypothetical protein
MAIPLKKLLGVKLLFDVRGLMAEEYADAGLLKPDGRLFRTVKHTERQLVRMADGIVVLTEEARGLLQEWYPQELERKPIQIIPCCADMRVWGRTEGRNVSRSVLHGRATRPLTFLYMGKLGGVYLTEKMTAFVAAARDQIGPIRWHVWTQSDPAMLKRLVREQGLESEVTIKCAAPEVVAKNVTSSDVGLTFMKQCTSRLATSPTKVGEYLASGLPVVTTASIGDLDDLLRKFRVGVSIVQHTENAYRDALVELRTLTEDPDTPARCYTAARECFDLERLGWPRYESMYRELLG